MNIMDEDGVTPLHARERLVAAPNEFLFTFKERPGVIYSALYVGQERFGLQCEDYPQEGSQVCTELSVNQALADGDMIEVKDRECFFIDRKIEANKAELEKLLTEKERISHAKNV